MTLTLTARRAARGEIALDARQRGGGEGEGATELSFR
jgi:hypothetical protein